MKVVKQTVTTFGDDGASQLKEVLVQVTENERVVLDTTIFTPDEIMSTYCFEQLCETAGINPYGYYTHPGGAYCHTPSWRVLDKVTVRISQWSGLDI